ncbi:mitochondrial import inner membrane translocase subunit Tim21 [Mantella aurantiaca]
MGRRYLRVDAGSDRAAIEPPNQLRHKANKEDITLRIYIGIFVFLVLFITGCSLYNNLYDQLSPSSPIRLHDNALEKCRNHPEIIETFGKNINDYGCFTPKRKEQKIWAAVYKRYHFKCMRLTFFISSSKVKLATVKVDLKKNTISGRYEVRFIIVEIEGDPKRTITVEENRYDHI